MAVYECDFGHHRYPQAQQSIYYTHLIGRTTDTYKMRLCPKDFRDSLVRIAEVLTDLDEDTKASNTCDLCTEDRVGTLFAKVFPLNQEMRQFVGDFCADHLSSMGNDLRILNGDHFSNA